MPEVAEAWSVTFAPKMTGIPSSMLLDADLTHSSDNVSLPLSLTGTMSRSGSPSRERTSADPSPRDHAGELPIKSRRPTAAAMGRSRNRCIDSIVLIMKPKYPYKPLGRGKQASIASQVGISRISVHLETATNFSFSES
jgi:hypothetical protein